MARQLETEKRLYRRTVWKGRYMNYECAMCAYATLDAMRMAEHLRAVHGRAIEQPGAAVDVEASTPARARGATAAVKSVGKSVDDEVTR